MLQWLAADLRTGRILADLTSLDVDWPLKRTLSNYESATAHLYLSDAPENWERATLNGGAVLACYDDRIMPDGSQPKAIQWAGFVTLRHRDAVTDVVDLTLATLENYLDRRFVPDVTYTAGWRAIVADMVSNWILDGAVPGIPLQVSYSGAGTAPSSPLVWQNTDNATVLSRLGQLISQFGGEFTIEWDWSTDRESIVPTLYLADQIGQAVPAGLGPSVTFDMPGCVSAASQDEDYSSDAGANSVTAYSTGQGDYTPYAAPVVAASLNGRPTFEYRYSPVPSETNTARLQTFAGQALKILGPGAQTFALTVTRDNDDHHRYGVHWNLGDYIGYALAPCRAFPNGLAGVGRAIAVEVGENDTTPTLYQPEVYVTPGG